MNRKRKHTASLPALLLILVLGMSLFTGCQGELENTGGAAPGYSAVSEPSDAGIAEANDASVSIGETDSTKEAENDTDIETTDSAGPETSEAEAETAAQQYYFRNAKLLVQHYEKHGIEMGFASAEEYEAAASAVITNPDALHKKEQEDNDEVYYVEDTNEFAVLSDDGYIRTYFYPNAGIKYYERQ